MAMLYPNLCYNNMCFKGTLLYYVNKVIALIPYLYTCQLFQQTCLFSVNPDQSAPSAFVFLLLSVSQSDFNVY